MREDRPTGARLHYFCVCIGSRLWSPKALGSGASRRVGADPTALAYSLQYAAAAQVGPPRTISYNIWFFEAWR